MKYMNRIKNIKEKFRYKLGIDVSAENCFEITEDDKEYLLKNDNRRCDIFSGADCLAKNNYKDGGEVNREIWESIVHQIIQEYRYGDVNSDVRRFCRDARNHLI